MILDEAIEHAKSVARTCNDSQCAADHLQLAEWLRTARGAEKAWRYFTRDIRELKSKLQDVERENAVLRQQLVDVTGSMGRVEERCAKLREENKRLVAMVEQLHDVTLEDELVRVESENDKLRELCRELWPFVKAGWVHACPNRECCLFEECDADSEYECLIEEHMAGRMRELGIEVD